MISTELGEERPNLMASFVNDGSIMGLLFGCIAVGKIVTYPSLGRMNTMKLGNLVVILGCFP